MRLQRLQAQVVQQLFVFNSPLVEQQSRTLAVMILNIPDRSAGERIALCYQQLFQRPPRPAELQAGLQFLLDASKQGAVPETDCWSWYVQSLFGLNEFLFVD